MSESERYLGLEDKLQDLKIYLLTTDERDQSNGYIGVSPTDMDWLLSVPAPNGFEHANLRAVEFIKGVQKRPELDESSILQNTIADEIKASAFRLLSHAEIESFIEDRAKEVVDAATKCWAHQQKATRTILSLLNFYVDQEKPPLDEIRLLALLSIYEYLNSSNFLEEAAKPDVPDISKMIVSASKYFNLLVQKNHGIRQTNLNNLLNPVGVDITALDPIWLMDMDSFGEKRGTSAHNSLAAWPVKSPIDPKSEIKTVDNLLKGLHDLDTIINKLISENRIDMIKSERDLVDWNQFLIDPDLLSIFDYSAEPKK